MTICITYRYKTVQGKEWLIALTDSRLTRIGAKENPLPSDTSEDKGTLLPSNMEIKHQNDHATKLHLLNKAGSDGRQAMISVAGAVALGLHSLLHLESVMESIFMQLNFNQFISKSESVMEEFWETSFDRDVEYLMGVRESNGKARLFQFTGEKQNQKFEVEELQEEHDLLLGLIGDKVEETKKEIICLTQSMLYTFDRIDDALDAACHRVLRKRLADPSDLTVGGNVNMAIMADDCRHVYVEDDEVVYFRGLKLAPAELPPGVFPLRKHHWYLARYDPKVPVNEIKTREAEQKTPIQEFAESLAENTDP